MVVSVRHMLGTLLSRIARGNILGDSLLVRARTTSFALLGATAAVGLSVIAIALQENWPLVAGTPPPAAVAGRTSIGGATAVGAAKPSGIAGAHPRSARGAATTPRSGVASRGGGHGRASSPVDSAPAATTELVVAPSVPVESGGGGSSGGSHSTGGPGPHAPRSPGGKPPATPSQPPPAPVSPPPAAAPAPVPPPVPATPPPAEATVSASPPPTQPYPPPGGNGQGHAYGREDGGYGHGGYGHGHGDDGESGDGHDD
jgi:hypothetical protein